MPYPIAATMARGSKGQIAAPFTPASLAGLILDLDSTLGLYQDAAGTTPAVLDTDPVGLWQDQSGLGHHATQTTDNARPLLKLNQINSLPGLLFDGSNDFLSLGNPATLQVGASDVVTIFVVYASTNNAATQCLLGQNNTAGAMMFQVTTAAAGNSNRSIIVPGQYVMETLNNLSLEGVTTPFNSWEVLGYRREGSGANTQDVWRNGVHMWVKTDADISFTGHGTKDIGRRAAGSSQFAGPMARMLIWNRALTLDEVDSVQDYLLTLYAINPVDYALWSGGVPDFTVVWVPDSQFLAQGKPRRLLDMYQWMKHRKATMGIGLVLGEGDLVETVGTAAEWTAEDAAVDIIDAAEIPYLLAAGNHDYDDGRPRDFSTYNGTFPQSRLAAHSWFNGGFYEAGHSENAYLLITLGGVNYLVIMLDYGPAQGTIDWAAALCDTYSDRDVIIVTHSYLDPDNTRTTTGDAYNPHGEMGAHPACHDGEEMWQELVKLKPNIVWVGSGHTYAAGPDGVGYLASVGDNGNTVHQHLANYQTYNGGVLGYLRIWQKVGNTVNCFTFSPATGHFLADADNQFSVTYKP